MSSLLLICCLFLSGGKSCHPGANTRPITINQQSASSEISDLINEVTASDEPAVRVLLRLKIAAYLWKYSDGVHDPEAIAIDAQKDLDAHEREIPALYQNLFRRELAAQLKTHDTKKQALPAEASVTRQLTELEVAYSLLKQENGAGKAVELAQKNIASGKEIDPIVTFFLDRLEEVKPEEVPRLLDALMAAEESRPASISPTTLLTLKRFFLGGQAKPELRRRFLAAVIHNASDTNADTASLADTYAVLADVLPVVERELPDAYPTASIKLGQLAEWVPAATRERIDVDKRVSESREPLAQLLLELSTVSDVSLKADLQTQAARLALEKEQFRTAVDIARTLHPKDGDAQLWREQFLEKVVASALEKREVEAAEYGAAQIQTTGIRASALQKIALFYIQKANDVVSARGTLESALKLLKATDDNAAKAGALLDLASSYAKVDGQRTPEVLRMAVTIINNTLEVSGTPHSDGAKLNSVETKMMIASRLIPAFRSLAAVDEYEATTVANGIQRRDLKAAAKVGVHTVEKPQERVAAN